jgi:hypothetical protein
VTEDHATMTTRGTVADRLEALLAQVRQEYRPPMALYSALANAADALVAVLRGADTYRHTADADEMYAAIGALERALGEALK